MSSRTGIYLVGGTVAVVVILLLLALFAWSLRADGEAGSIRANGSFLHPQVQREARSGYVLAELYQDVHLDVASGVYDRDGTLLDRYWSHDPSAQSCGIDLVLADQHGRVEIEPTATPRLPDPTATPGPAVVLAAIYDGATEVLPDRTVVVMPTPTPVGTPSPTPYPTATPVLTSSIGWNHWKGRPIVIEADGLAVLEVPRDARVSAHLSVLTGPDSGHGSQTELARMPLPEPSWSQGSAHVRLADASGRILLASDAIDATYRAAALHLQVAPLSDCAGMRLRWQRPAAVVVKALTAQPFLDWGDRTGPTPLPPAAPLYAAIGPDGFFDPGEMRGGVSSTAPGHVVIPDASQDSHVAFAIRADLIPGGLSDVRQTGSPFNARGAFAPDVGDPDVLIDVAGTDYKLYVSLMPWRAQLLGGEWSLR